MGLSVAVDISITNFVLNSVTVILRDNSRCHDFQEAIEKESKAFEAYVWERTIANQEAYNRACARTESCIIALPFDYQAIGAQRYARTWNIKNGYEGYRGYRDRIFQMNTIDGEFVNSLYRVYEMQAYLQTYARRLVQDTLNEGNARYEEKVPVFQDIPILIVATSLFMIAIAASLTGVMSKTLTQPLEKLAHSSRKIARNDFSGPDLIVENEDEMGELVTAFNKMKHATEGYINTLMENHKMMELLHKEEIEKVDAEKRLDAVRLDLLKSQINPHFLFNTLNMIAGMAEMETADTTVRMITSLSHLFRYNLDTVEQVVLLERELKAVTDYTYLQQMRFGNRIQYECKLEVDPAQVTIPAFTLQPLVENAIVHGLSKKEEGGRICLRIWQGGTAVMVSVADTGVGMDEERRQELIEALVERRTADVGIGLGNIYQRIQTMYENGDLKIYSKKGRGTVIQMTIPQEQGEKDVSTTDSR